MKLTLFLTTVVALIAGIAIKDSTCLIIASVNFAALILANIVEDIGVQVVKTIMKELRK